MLRWFYSDKMSFLQTLLPRRKRSLLLKLALAVTLATCLLLWTGHDLGSGQVTSALRSVSQSSAGPVDSGVMTVAVTNDGATDGIVGQNDALAAAPTRLELRRFDGEIDADLRMIDPELGKNGEPVHFSGKMAALADKLMKKEAFNIVASDRISLNRSVPDARHHLCHGRVYDTELPKASVVVIFTNEPMSTLMRTIHSVVNRSPHHLLTEIILVDDFSDRVELHGKLERYIQRFFRTKRPVFSSASLPAGVDPGEEVDLSVLPEPAGARPGPWVRLVRLPRRSGLIRARLAGARIATASVLVFLDSHCECGQQWLEPLLQRIGQQRSAVLTPVIDVIDDKTLQYYHSNGDFFQVGGFTWSGHFTWINVDHAERTRAASLANPTRSPTMAGGLFAIDREYFWRSGSYDHGMDVWGGENLEMSFRIWMCGGSIEAVPCSRVGHIFRDFHPYSFPGDKDTHGINTARLVEVWMDDYKRLFYLHRPDLKHADIGSVTSRVQFRREHRCRSFKWYLDNVVPGKFVPDENVQLFGQVLNEYNQPNICLDNLQNDDGKTYQLGMYNCHNFIATSQLFSLTDSGELRREESCAAVAPSTSSSSSSSSDVVMTKCQRSPHQRWHFLPENGWLKNEGAGLCLDTGDLAASGGVVVARPCRHQRPQQRWRLRPISALSP